MKTARRLGLKRRMSDVGMQVGALALRSGYHRSTIKRFRNGDRTIGERAWRLLNIAIDDYERESANLNTNKINPERVAINASRVTRP